jgi:hypothetical protein
LLDAAVIAILQGGVIWQPSWDGETELSRHRGETEASRPLAALGLLVIIIVAMATSGRQRIKLNKPIDESDRIDDWLYCRRRFMPLC